MTGEPEKRLSKKGKILLEDNKALISFGYDEACFKILTRTQGASYNKEGKRWEIPLVQLPTVLKCGAFSKSRFDLQFSEEILETKLDEMSGLAKEARERVSKNPFSVAQEDLALISVDVRFETDTTSEWIKLLLSKDRKLRRTIDSISFLVKSGKRFLIQPSRLGDLLKTLRDKGHTFAVESELAKRLKESALERGKILSAPQSWNSDIVRKGKIVPALVWAKGNKKLTLIGAPKELRELIVPVDKRSARLNSLSPAEALAIFNQALLSPFPIYFPDLELKRLVNELDSDSSEVREFRALQRGPTLTVNSKGEGGIFLPSEGRFVAFSRQELDQAYEISEKVTKGERCFVTSKFENLLLKEKAGRELREKQRVYHELKDAQITLSVKGLSESLYPHQRIAVKWISDNSYGLLGDDMGLGKTLSVLCGFIADNGERSQECDFLLVVCPNSLVRNWVREAKRWVPNLNLLTLPSGEKGRTEILSGLSTGNYSSANGLVINFELARTEKIWPKLVEVTRSRRVFLCVDESQRIKNPQSQSFKAIKEISSYATKRFLLSGTPTPRDIADIWGQMLILDGGERFGRSYYRWLESIAELGTKWSDYAVKRYLPGAIDDTTLRIREVLLRRQKEEVINLPEKIFVERDVELRADQAKRYDEIRSELRIKLEALGWNTQEKPKHSILEEFLRAVQIGSNPRLVDPEWKGEPAKFIELDEIVSEIVEERGEKIVIWTNYLGNVRELCERYKKHSAMPFSGEVSTKDRQETLIKFQDLDSKNRILVAIPAAGGVGITLTAAQTAVYLDRTWNAEHWLQSIDRIHRIGQKGTVTIITLNASPVDEIIGRSLKKKQELLKRVLDSAEDLDTLPTLSELKTALMS